jgi:hypothetical protein
VRSDSCAVNETMGQLAISRRQDGKMDEGEYVATNENYLVHWLMLFLLDRSRVYEDVSSS